MPTCTVSNCELCSSTICQTCKTGYYRTTGGLNCYSTTYCPLDPYCSECVEESCTTCKSGYKLQGSTLCSRYCPIENCKECSAGLSNLINLI